MRLILIVISIRSDHGSGITVLVTLNGRENGILGTHEILSRPINEDFTLNPQKTGGKVIGRRYS
jgi:hypothetical protein